MTPRLNPYKAAPEAMKALVALENYVQNSGLDRSPIDLVKTRASETELVNLTLCVAAINAWNRSASARFIRYIGGARPDETTEKCADWRTGMNPRIPKERQRSERVARIRLGSYEFKKKGISRFDLRDPYHLAVALTWRQFLAALLTLYLSVNFVFAVLYWAVPGSVANARPNSFGDNLFFSIETLATVGYGEMYPATLYGRVVAATEIVCGFAFTAILTGLTFVRFSRPRAKLVFASNPVVAMHNGKPTLMVRIGNGRPAMLADAAAKLNVVLCETTTQGKRFHRARELRLERAHLPAFPFYWTLMHVLDEQSPLDGYDMARVIDADARVFVTLEARDPTLATVVHDIHVYAPQDIRFGMRYADVITTAEDGTPVADLTRMGELEPDVGDRPESGWSEREEKLE